MATFSYLELEELLIHILKLPEESDAYNIDEYLYREHGCSIESIERILHLLVPLIDVGVSPLTGKKYKGFSKQVKDHKEWLLKIKIND